MSPDLVMELLDWAKTSEVHMLICSCVFHYELELIHPFADGNGRVGRLWHTLLLSKWNPSSMTNSKSITQPSTPPIMPESPLYLLSFSLEEN